MKKVITAIDNIHRVSLFIEFPFLPLMKTLLDLDKGEGRPGLGPNRWPTIYLRWRWQSTEANSLQLKTVFNQRVVQKASFRRPEFIGFFAPISEIRAGPLPTVN
jgi:hypothetical protein